MKTKFFKTLVVATALLQIVACGKGRQQQTNVNNGVGPGGVPASLEQKVNAVLSTYRCQSGDKHQLSVLRFSNAQAGMGGQKINAVGLNENGAKQTAVGVNVSNNDVAVVKDYSNGSMDIYFYMCDRIIINNASLLTIVETTAANYRCSFNQILTLDVAFINTNVGPFNALFSKVDLRASIPNVCEQEFGYGPQPIY